MNYKVDLHSHSIISHDGGISADEYEKILKNTTLDCIAITDHNETSFACIMQKRLGGKIIIGEEITTTAGEIIGLYLQETIPAGLDPVETVKQIKQQNGLVYIPHPFEVFRKGLKLDTLEMIKKDIDIIEVFNGRGTLRGKPDESLAFASTYGFAKAASGDAHCVQGLGYTYSQMSELPTRKSLKHLLSEATLSGKHAPFYTLAFPMINRIKNKIVTTHV